MSSSSAIVKDILRRSGANDVCTRRIVVKEKYGADKIDLNRWCGRARATWSRGSRIRASGFSKPEPRGREAPSSPPQAILTPVSDPTPTTKKVWNFMCVCVCVLIIKCEPVLIMNYNWENTTKVDIGCGF